MDYKMFTANCSADDNIIDLINKDLIKKGLNNSKGYIRFVGFEGEAGTAFKINGDQFVIPKVGHFVTRFTGERGEDIYSLYFNNGCTGLNIYYII